jgi:hypothetical protein
VRGFDNPKAFGNAIHLYIERAIHPRKLGGARPIEVLIASATVRFIGIAILWADTGSTKPLATHSQTIHWVKPRRTQYEQISSGLPRQRTLLNTVGMSQRCQTRSREPYSITSSARASNVGGKSRPSALAVLRLRTRSYFDACSTGKSDGFSPLRILSM